MIIALLLLCAGMFGAYQLQQIHRAQELEIIRLNEVVARLESESRVAQVMVKKQDKNPATGLLETELKFAEIDRDGKPLPPRTFKVEGDIAYFDALVIKFDREYVERGEELRGKSICLFRRIFGENQTPEDGFPIDDRHGERGGIPDIYRVDPDPSAFEVDLWNDFWHYATHPEDSKEKGIRVIQGEAVYQQLTKENIYTLTLDSDGGLNIVAAPIPAILKDELNAAD